MLATRDRIELGLTADSARAVTDEAENLARGQLTAAMVEGLFLIDREHPSLAQILADVRRSEISVSSGIATNVKPWIERALRDAPPNMQETLQRCLQIDMVRRSADLVMMQSRASTV